MQIETLHNVPKPEKQYLRVATISNKTALCYLYIGTDEKSQHFLNESFQSGLTAENLSAAKQLLRPQSAAEIDLIILDVDYHEKELRDFQSFLRNRQLTTIPVIYNQQYLQNNEFIKESELVDDVIDLNNWQFDFSSKVAFLKKSKEYRPASERASRNLRPSQPVGKRMFDIVISLLLLVVSIPVFLLIALAIRLESRGPIFYTSKRAGRGFRIFKFFKFRTMEVNADKKIDALAHLNQYGSSASARFFKINNDPRITRVGRFLRNTSLDELPQLFNVLKGDMSLVGNRPLPLYEAATLTTNEFVERFMAPAGITGLWQIKKRGKSDMSTEERISLDISYARNASMLNDLWIMANTPKALLQKTDV